MDLVALKAEFYDRMVEVELIMGRLNDAKVLLEDVRKRLGDAQAATQEQSETAEPRKAARRGRKPKLTAVEPEATI